MQRARRARRTVLGRAWVDGSRRVRGAVRTVAAISHLGQLKFTGNFPGALLLARVAARRESDFRGGGVGEAIRDLHGDGVLAWGETAEANLGTFLCRIGEKPGRKHDQPIAGIHAVLRVRDRA